MTLVISRKMILNPEDKGEFRNRFVFTIIKALTGYFRIDPVIHVGCLFLYFFGSTIHILVYILYFEITFILEVIR